MLVKLVSLRRGTLSFERNEVCFVLGINSRSLSMMLNKERKGLETVCVLDKVNQSSVMRKKYWL